MTDRQREKQVTLKRIIVTSQQQYRKLENNGARPLEFGVYHTNCNIISNQKLLKLRTQKVSKNWPLMCVSSEKLIEDIFPQTKE